MIIKINNEEVSVISFLKEKCGLKKATFGLTIEDNNFTLLIASTDSNWSKPLFVSGPIASATELISEAFIKVSEGATIAVASTNAETVVEEEKEVKKPEPKTSTKTTGKKKGGNTAENQEKKKEEKKKKEDIPETKPPEIDWSNVEKYEKQGNLLMAKWYVNELKKRHSKDPVALQILEVKYQTLDEAIETAKTQEKEEVKKEEATETEIRTISENNDEDVIPIPN